MLLNLQTLMLFSVQKITRSITSYLTFLFHISGHKHTIIKSLDFIFSSKKLTPSPVILTSRMYKLIQQSKLFHSRISIGLCNYHMKTLRLF